MSHEYKLKSTGEPVSILGTIAKRPDSFAFRLTGKQQSGRRVAPRKVEHADLKTGYVRVLIHHGSHTEQTIINRSKLVEA